MSNSKNFSLIVPVAADKPEYSEQLPYLFSPGSDGVFLCVKSILGLNIEAFDAIYFTVLRKHVERFDIDTLLKLQFRRLGLNKAKVVILDQPTETQAETIVCTIEKENIKDAIFIKDADGYFSAEILPENGVAVFPLEELDIVDPRNKSYVAVDDMHYVTNIIEKKIVSHLFNAGGYCFESVNDFMVAYKTLKGYGKIYLSHLIYSMLLEKFSFRPIEVRDYVDWGTAELYRYSSQTSSKI